MQNLKSALYQGKKVVIVTNSGSRIKGTFENKEHPNDRITIKDGEIISGIPGIQTKCSSIEIELTDIETIGIPEEA